MPRKSKKIKEVIENTSASTICSPIDKIQPVIDNSTVPNPLFDGTVINSEANEKEAMKPLSELTNRELLDLEKITFIVCERLEKSVSQYMGGYNTNSDNFQTFNKCNIFHGKIMAEMQRRIEERIAYGK